MKTQISILSRYGEVTTDRVIEYLDYLGKKNDQTICLGRLNSEDEIKKIFIRIDNKESSFLQGLVKTDVSTILLSDVQKGWYRRGHYNQKKISVKSPQLTKTLLDESAHINRFVDKHLCTIGGFFEEVENNKLENLYVARSIGLHIPTTIITSEKEELKKFFNSHHKIITKPIHNGHISYEENGFKYISNGTQLITEENIETLNARFGLSLFQQYIEKYIELRVFYILGQIYAMAIFSQLDEQTSVDYRHYNEERQNRTVPFRFPPEIQIKIVELFERLDMKTGSADFILTKSGRYVFLEINPTGQYGWVSKHCNYYINKRIAEALLN